MKICITSEGKTLESNLDMRFGRCAYFIIFDTDTNEFKAVENTNVNLTGGAGIQSAQSVISSGVKAVLTGKVGQNAYNTLKTAGIEIYLSNGGGIKNVIEQYKTGKLEKMN
ncbi:MAG: NifB/NifX family molybdenum-iron cluster-binding protein [Elusimicrobiota bacterium]